MSYKNIHISKMDEDYLKMAAQAAALAFDVDAEDVLSRKRTEPLVFARQTAYWLIYFGLKYSYSKTGRMFERDHGGVMHGIRKVKDVLELDLNRMHRNGSWADKVRVAKANFIRFHETYIEADLHKAMKETDYVVPAS